MVIPALNFIAGVFCLIIIALDYNGSKLDKFIVVMAIVNFIFFLIPAIGSRRSKNV